MLLSTMPPKRGRSYSGARTYKRRRNYRRSKPLFYWRKRRTYYKRRTTYKRKSPYVRVIYSAHRFEGEHVIPKKHHFLKLDL
jgi:hypothetical protein